MRAIAVALTFFFFFLSPLTAQERGFTGFIFLEDGETIAEKNADRLFVPGSVQKLLTATAALHHLGPDHRVVTRLHAAGAVTDSVLDGDLVLVGAGDPTWNEHFSPDAPHAALHSLAAQVRQRGVLRVRGDLVLDVHRFPGRVEPLSRPLAEASYAWAAPVSALAIDENRVFVRIAPGSRPGEPGSASWDDPASFNDWTLEPEIITAPKELHDRGTVEFLPDRFRRRLVVRGEYPVSEPSYRVPASVPAPALRVGDLLREALRAAGVEIEGEVRRSETAVSIVKELARVESPPLAELLPPILEDSHNWYAEMLLRIVALETRGDGRLETGLEVLKEFLTTEIGADESSFVLDDGSGLSPWNLIAPRTVAELLTWARRRPWRSAFEAALARPGRGTLRVWPKLPPLRAKTGTLGHNLGIAGFADSKIFVVLLGHRPDERPVLRREIASLISRHASASKP